MAKGFEKTNLQQSKNVIIRNKLLNKNILVNRVKKSIERTSRDDRNVLAEQSACNYLEK